MNSSKHYAILAMCIFPLALEAQVQHALDFDGIDDQVIVANGSGLIAGSNQVSLTCWVYPTNPAPAFPDFDGFAGFRNNTDADFYILHFTTNSVEARFRNSTGTDFNIISQGLQLNTWQHYALTYDGSMLRLYHNGQPADSVSASGSIATSSESFYIGNLLFSGTDFLLTGKMDEVSLWTQTLTADEVSCIYASAVDTAATGLAIYYRFNQGVAGANNAGITLLEDATGNLDGSLLNFALNGPSSNWITGVSNFTEDSVVLCPGDSLFYHGQVFTQPGNYTVYQAASPVCDSVFELSLQVVDTGVTINGLQLLANQPGAAYQWIRCDSGFAAIPGAVNQGYTPLSGGSYAVVIMLGGCTDTSNCHSYSPVGIGAWPRVQFTLLPDPAGDAYIVTAPGNYNWVLTVSDVSGRLLLRRQLFSPSTRIDAAAWDPGTYLVGMEAGRQRLVRKVIR